MPELLLRGNHSDLGLVTAVMLFPSNEHLRDSAMARMRAEASVLDLKDSHRLEVTAGSIRSLLDAPSRDELTTLKHKAARAGLIAGDILTMLYAMTTTDAVRMPSWNKAVYAYPRWGESGTAFRDGTPLPKSRSEIEKAWASHRCVAHFWGAVSLHRELGDGDLKKLFGPDWTRFLQMAAGLLKFGTEFVPQQRKHPRPTLDIAESWTLPDGISPELPPVSQLPARLMELLDGYRAPQSV